jgi:8-oxo-dGTP pyrophosphatase MutT (NUDIX family)
MQWQIHGERPIYENPWVSLWLTDVQQPDGRRWEHHVVKLRHLAVAVVVDDQKRVLMMWRHRFITDTWGWEIPAGRVDPGETLEQAAEREAIEETGWRPLDLEYTGFSHPTNGLMQQRFEYFLSPRAERVGDFDRTETESIAWFAPDDVRTLIEQGEIPDGLSVSALATALALGRL